AFTKTSPEQAMMLTCYGSLAYCCSLSRNCSLRDEAIRLLGMNKEEYKAIQQECHQRFLRHYESRWPHDQISPSHSETTSPSYLSFIEREPQEVEDYWREKTTTSSSRTQDYSRRSSDPSTPSVDLGNLFGSSTEVQTRHTPAYHEPRTAGTRTTYERRSFSPDEWHASHGIESSSQSQSLSIPRGFCIYCGQDLIEGSEFCPRCGRDQK
ncbi:MAG: hypothetical protein ACFFDP_12680, partial [Promethearchaeota archaeon]